MTEPVSMSTLEMDAEPETQSTLPWPPRPGTSAIAAFFRTWTDCMFRPGEFFSRVPESGEAGAAVLYYALIGMIAAVVELFWHLLFAFAAGVFAYVTRIYEVFGLTVNAYSPIIGFFFTPALLALMLAVVFAVVHAGLWIFGGARRGAGTTLRVLCYAYSARLFGIIPFIGGLVGTIWMFVLAIVGLSKAHRTDGWRAALAVILPVVVTIAMALMLGVLMAVAIGARLG